MSKETRPYTVITAARYWGKGDTPIEAAKNAEVNSTFVKGTVYFAHPQLVKGEVDCNSYGGASWMWEDDVMEMIDEKSWLYNVFKDKMITIGELRIHKGKLEVKVIYE